MRVICEHCSSAQPPDWQAGDLCLQCGQTVRRERRCQWCTRLTPDGKFCRSCGSGLVADQWYGAARMLKAVGLDQFSLPERLEKMDPEQRSHFSRLYAPHDRLLERHVDDLSFVERFLRGNFARGDFARGDSLRGHAWSGALEEELLPQLPLSEERLKALSLPPAEAVQPLERLAEIRDGSPFPVTAQLAAVARVRLGAPRNPADAAATGAAIASPDERVREAAALALGRWPYTASTPYGVQVRDLERALMEVYRRSGSLEAAIGVTLLKQQYANVWGVDVPLEEFLPLLGSENPDLAFGAALALGHVESLLPALRVPERRYVASLALAKLGQAQPLVSVFADLEPHQQERVMDKLRYGVGAVPALHDELVKLLEGNRQSSLQRSAAQLLALENRPEDALRLIEADGSLADAVLRNERLAPRELERICLRLLETGAFNLYLLSALSEIASGERVADSFVPEAFGAADEYGRQELCSFAQTQLEARGNPGLHRFLWGVLEGDFPRQARERVWAALNGWYFYTRSDEPTLGFSLGAARHYFGDVQNLLSRVSGIFERPAILRDLYCYDDFLKILQDVNPDILPAILARPSDLDRFRGGLWSLVYDRQAYSANRLAAVTLLGRLAVSSDERIQFESDARDLFLTDPPWDVRRATLEALHDSEREVLQVELRELLEGNQFQGPDHREIAVTLLDGLQEIASRGV